VSEQVVIAIYRPREGGDERLRELIAGHVPTLRRVGLATSRPALLLRTLDGGAYLEVFGWVDEHASSRAHETPEVQAIWGAMGEVADFVALGELAEAAHRFPHFEPVEP